MFYLEGGFGAVVEGLDYSHIPCTRRLSVAGFLVINGPKGGKEAVIPEGREAPFLRKEGGSLQPPD